MTVEQLIKKLQQFPKKLEVVIYDEMEHRWLDSDMYVFPDKQMTRDMKEDNEKIPKKRLVLSFNGKFD